ncbi:hypothetical protein MTDSW087_01417 [Methylobacterium dankookense]|uniref:Uncharacterized protein n=1 Tax=Methylobacterium dankookense TaxID=560405 RepID=A0A564FUH2_9HYPH|nr:hypothetical protein IFDJLNFL_3195 [Methylobacterium dankookense]VUF11733.1 hypothetical protein MTDSW087_01417 [Methylobacterium dankookense]
MRGEAGEKRVGTRMGRARGDAAGHGRFGVSGS